MPTHPKKKQGKPVHYTVMAALFMLTITTFGLSVIMAEFLSFGLVGVVQEGSNSAIHRVNAKVIKVAKKKAAMEKSMPVPQPGQPTLCDLAWIQCSDRCDSQYTDNLLTSTGWERCERDCDLRALRCEKVNDWSEEITVRDTRFAP